MSNMVVRTNVFALNSHRNLTNTGLQQRQAAQRLSSGYRINSAADDAAGLAISEAMRAQIRGLDQASINAQDGVGLIQTAEGAMATVSEMVIRIRELMVQAANDTYVIGNREMIQLEIDQLMTEINDVTFRTQFNTRTLLDGGLSGGGGPTSPVSLQWMLFDQVRTLGMAVPGGSLMPNERTENSLRNNIIAMQSELDDLIESIARRQIADNSQNLSAADFNAAFRNRLMPMPVVNGLDAVFPLFDSLDQLGDLTASEQQQLRSIANRLNNAVLGGVREVQNLYETTSDQIRALGGRSATNADGTSVFIPEAMSDWFDDVGFYMSASDLRTAIESFTNSGTGIGVNAPATNSSGINDINNAGGGMRTAFDVMIDSALTGSVQGLADLFAGMREMVGFVAGSANDVNVGTQREQGYWNWNPAVGPTVFTAAGVTQPDVTAPGWSAYITSQLPGSPIDGDTVNYGVWEFTWTEATPGPPPTGTWDLTGTEATPGAGDLGYMDITTGISTPLIDAQGRSWLWDARTGGTNDIEGHSGAVAGWVLVQPDTTVAANPPAPESPGNRFFVAPGQVDAFTARVDALRQAAIAHANAVNAANPTAAPIEPDFSILTVANILNVGFTLTTGAITTTPATTTPMPAAFLTMGTDAIADTDIDVSQYLHNASINVSDGGGYIGHWSWTPSVLGTDGDGNILNPGEPGIDPNTLIGTRVTHNGERFDVNDTSSWLNKIERLLDVGMGTLATVNLESNAMWFQIGPNSMQGMILQLQGMHTGILGGARGDLAMLIDVREQSGETISQQLVHIARAEEIVNAQRAQLGAVQNRLEFTRQSLDISSENLSAAESRIRDTDMAREMMRFTAAQVLQQAGISMLAQANQLPASILQLLQ